MLRRRSLPVLPLPLQARYRGGREGSGLARDQGDTRPVLPPVLFVAEAPRHRALQPRGRPCLRPGAGAVRGAGGSPQDHRHVHLLVLPGRGAHRKARARLRQAGAQARSLRREGGEPRLPHRRPLRGGVRASRALGRSQGKDHEGGAHALRPGLRKQAHPLHHGGHHARRDGRPGARLPLLLEERGRGG